MLSNYQSLQDPENTTEQELERLHLKLMKLEVYLYRRRLSHLKSLRKRVALIHREIDKAYHDAYQVYEIDMNNMAITIREFQDDIAQLRHVQHQVHVIDKSLNKSYKTA